MFQKTDRCDRCEEIKIKEQEKMPITEKARRDHDAHLKEKVLMRSEKNKDKVSCKGNKLMIVFDLQNVITLPKAEVSSFFYKRKLILYNLTAQTSTKQGYCAIWTEVTSGRAGNDIASGVIAIFTNVVEDHPEVTDIVCWSDSCVPQNRNSYISNAILEFLSKNKTIKSHDEIFSYRTLLCARG